MLDLLTKGDGVPPVTTVGTKVDEEGCLSCGHPWKYHGRYGCYYPTSATDTCPCQRGRRGR